MLCLIAGLFWVIDRNKILKQKYVKINETLTQQIVENKNCQFSAEMTLTTASFSGISRFSLIFAASVP